MSTEDQDDDPVYYDRIADIPLWIAVWTGFGIWVAFFYYGLDPLIAWLRSFTTSCP